MPAAARKTDPHTCPKVEPGPTPHVGGPISSPCSPDVDIECLPAARAEKVGSDSATCAAGGPDEIIEGSPNVIINNLSAVRVGDKTKHGGVIMKGAATVEIGIPGDAIRFQKMDSAAGASTDTKSGKGKQGGKTKGDDKKNGKGPASAQTSTSDGNVFARFEANSSELIVGSQVKFRCTSWDPDTKGSSETPNPSAMVDRRWEITRGRRDLVLGERQSGGRIEWWVTFRASGTSWPDDVKADVVQVALHVTDAQGHTSTATQDFFVQRSATSSAGVSARCELVSPQPVVRHVPFKVRCISWDPDTGGTAAAPNPKNIVRRRWQILPVEGTFPGYIDTVEGAGGADWNPTIVSKSRGEGASYFTTNIILTVWDEQGHTATADAIPLQVSYALTRPVAVITPVKEHFLSQTGSGFSPPLRFRCDSYSDKEQAPTPTPERIRNRQWKGVTSRGGSVTITVVEGSSESREIRIAGSSIDQLGPEDWIDLTLSVENEFNEFAGTILKVTRSMLPPVAKIRRSPEIISHRIIVGDSLTAVAGDRIKIHSLSHLDHKDWENAPNHGIDVFRWELRSSASVGLERVSESSEPFFEFDAPSAGSGLDEYEVTAFVKLFVRNGIGESSTEDGSGDTLRSDFIITPMTYTEALFRAWLDFLVGLGVAAGVILVAAAAAWCISGSVVIGGTATVIFGSETFFWLMKRTLMNRLGFSDTAAGHIITTAKVFIAGPLAYYGAVPIHEAMLRGEYLAIRRELGWKATDAWKAVVKRYQYAVAVATGKSMSEELIKKSLENYLEGEINKGVLPPPGS